MGQEDSERSMGQDEGDDDGAEPEASRHYDGAVPERMETVRWKGARISGKVSSNLDVNRYKDSQNTGLFTLNQGQIHVPKSLVFLASCNGWTDRQRATESELFRVTDSRLKTRLTSG